MNVSRIKRKFYKNTLLLQKKKYTLIICIPHISQFNKYGIINIKSY